ncbi:MAG: L-isoaspartyl protein carboxyl methyltransferase, partial [Candidatus Moranbacteria bacterium]|nr:L-isoaspartyl protein carboxyl methyltransferase [Candidatus Moranbacteria bacterium]
MFFSSNQQLVDFLERKGFIRSLQVKEAFLVVDRKKFVPEKFQEFAYYDQPIFIASGQTISQPATVAIMLELLGTQPGDKVLDIGAGSGWVSCLLSHLIGEAGKVYAYELNKKVGAFGKEVISNSNFENI